MGSSTERHNNRVYNDMKLFQSSTYEDPLPASITISTPSHDTQHGQIAYDSDFSRRDIWRNDPPAAGSSPAHNHGLGFSDEHWIFTTVNTHKYPILRASPNGQAMGGQ